MTAEKDWGSIVVDGYNIKLTQDQFNKLNKVLEEMDPLYKVKYGSVSFTNLPEHIIEEFRDHIKRHKIIES